MFSTSALNSSHKRGSPSYHNVVRFVFSPGYVRTVHLVGWLVGWLAGWLAGWLVSGWVDS